MDKSQICQIVNKTIKEDPDREIIKSISLFGSFLHGNYTDKSDVDLLIELNKNIGFFTLMSIQNRIEDKVGKPVQLMTRNSLSRYFRDKVIKEAERIY